MSRGFGLAMPLVIINLGGEMVYILEQRLKAQNISAEKSERVLSEVVRAMFSPALMQELFRPQPVYTCSATREVFDRLAHSSIMRLNASSMDKLYDLMTMGFKQQFVRCSQAADLLHVTLNHIEQLRAMVANTAPALELLAAVSASFLRTFGTLRAGELLAVRQQVGRFLQDRRVKVSLFLQNNTQNMNATFRLDTATPCSSSPHAAGAAAAAACERPGVVRYFNRDGRATREVAFHSELTERAGRADEAGAAQQMLVLGCNVYSIDAEHAAATGAKARQTLETAAQAKDDGGGGAGGTTGAKSTATAELNLLAKLMGTAAEERDAKPFKLNLFGDDDDDDGGYAAASSGGGVPTIHLDVGQHKSAAGMLAEMKFDDEHDDDAAPGGGAAERKRAHDEYDDDDDDDDLLDLMDSVS
jgi:hypothetical protein